ncbi:hypothetical protein ACPUER_14730 [Burkholderia sp. DN3021]|uniref:hypothetical protein n=1 Tax=Burkholderia sp. DN3021 TaxID=3410137 RepID=UPI003C79CA67
MDSLAVSYAAQLARWGIETSIVVPGAFTRGTNHFVHAGKPADAIVQAAYDSGPYAGVAEQALQGLAALEPTDADAGAVATAIADLVAGPAGARQPRSQNPRIASATAAGASRCGKCPTPSSTCRA